MILSAFWRMESFLNGGKESVKEVETVIKKLWNMFVNRETITYGIAGVLTTLVNFIVSYIGYYCLHWDENLVTVLAAAIAIIFAYIINKYWVFLEKSGTASDEAMKLGKFAAGRLFTLGVEWLGVYVFVTKLQIDFMLIKVILAVVVIVLNYIISKLFVFISDSGKKGEK